MVESYHMLVQTKHGSTLRGAISANALKPGRSVMDGMRQDVNRRLFKRNELSVLPYRRCWCYGHGCVLSVVPWPPPRTTAMRYMVGCSNASFMMLVTRAGFADPPDRLMTCPTKNPRRFDLPPRYFSRLSGLSRRTSSTS